MCVVTWQTHGILLCVTFRWISCAGLRWEQLSRMRPAAAHLCHQKQYSVKASNLIFCFHQTCTIPPSVAKTYGNSTGVNPFGKSVARGGGKKKKR